MSLHKYHERISELPAKLQRTVLLIWQLEGRNANGELMWAYLIYLDIANKYCQILFK